MSLIKRCTVALGLSLAACGGAKQEPHAAADEMPPQAPAEGAKKPWKELSQEERVALMKNVVLPRMKTAFQTQDAEHFKEFGCVTCHGPGAKQGRFTMPNVDLPKLNPAGGFAAHMKDPHTASMVEFMRDKVVPNMSDILGVPPWNPETKSGFGCGNCHVMEQ